MNFAANLLRNRQNLLFYTPKEQLLQGRNENLRKMRRFFTYIFPRDTRIVHTLFTPNLGSLKESTLYFSHSLKQRATNKKFWGPLSTSPNGQSGRPRKTPRRGVMIKIKESCKQTGTGESFPSFSRRCCILHFELNRCGAFSNSAATCSSSLRWGRCAGRPFLHLPHFKQSDALRPARCGHLHSSSPRSSRGESAWRS